MLKKYYENTRHFTCVECGEEFTLSFWQWIFTTMKLDPWQYRFVRCPACDAIHWLKAKTVM